MPQFPFAIVGSDLDGTLLDMSGDPDAAVNHALHTTDRPMLPVERGEPMVGGGARHMLARALTASTGVMSAKLNGLLAALLAHGEANIAAPTHAVGTSDTLRSRGVICAMITTRRVQFTRTLSDEFDLLGHFGAIIGGDTLGDYAAKPRSDGAVATIERGGGRRAAFNGVSIYNAEGTHAAGVPVSAYAFGLLQPPVRSFGADAMIDGFDQFDPALEWLTL